MATMTCKDCPTKISEKLHGNRLCRPCFRARYTIPAAKRRKEKAATGVERTCSKCTETKPGNEFYATSAYCKLCQKAYNAERAAARSTEPTIYIIGCKLTGLVKIGYTASAVEKRLADLQVGSPTKLTVLATYPGTRTTEKQIHAEFNAARVHGEWFNLTPAQTRRVHEMLGRKKATRARPHPRKDAPVLELVAA